MNWESGLAEGIAGLFGCALLGLLAVVIVAAAGWAWRLL
jgi:hypothetical protein